MNGSGSTQGNIRTLGERGSPLSKIIVVVVVDVVVGVGAWVVVVGVIVVGGAVVVEWLNL